MDWQAINPGNWIAKAIERTHVRQPTTNSYMPLPPREYEVLRPAATARWFKVWDELKQRLSLVEHEFAQFEGSMSPSISATILAKLEALRELPGLEQELAGRFPDDSPEVRHRKGLLEALESLNRARNEPPLIRDKYEARGLSFLLRAYRSIDVDRVRKGIEPLLGDVGEHRDERTRQLARVATAKRNLASHLKAVTDCFNCDVPTSFRNLRIDPDDYQLIAESIVSSFIAEWRHAAKFHGPPVSVFGTELTTMPHPRDWQEGYAELRLGDLPKQSHLFRPRVTQADHDPVQAA